MPVPAHFVPIGPSMSGEQIRATTPSASAGRVDATYLPIGLVDVELSMPPTEFVDDTTVFLLGSADDQPAAVLKVARGPLGAAQLHTQRRVLSELATHRGVDGEWRELLPRILAFDKRTGATLSVESFRPGTDLAELLARRPDRVEELTAAALKAIAPLHRRTATFVGVSNAIMLRRWIAEPLAGLTGMCRRLDPDRACNVDRLSAMLRRDLHDWAMPVSWTHGAYLPANVRFDGTEDRVTGIVDWGGARSGRPALIDEYLMVLMASCQVEQADFGTVVTERLRAGGLLERERNALRAGRHRPDAEVGGRDRAEGRVDECVAILLTWLHRVSEVWRKRATRPNHYAWWATDVAPVLDAAAAWHPTGDAARLENRKVGEWPSEAQSSRAASPPIALSNPL